MQVNIVKWDNILTGKFQIHPNSLFDFAAKCALRVSWFPHVALKSMQILLGNWWLLHIVFLQNCTYHMVFLPALATPMEAPAPQAPSFFVILSGQVRFYRDDNWVSTSIPLAYSYWKQPWKVATAPLPTIPWPLYSIPSSISTLDELSSKRVNNWIPTGNQTWQWKNPL